MGKKGNNTKKSKGHNPRTNSQSSQSSQSSAPNAYDHFNSKNNKINKKSKHQKKSSSSSIDDTQFRQTLQTQGYTIHEMSPDGNCLFRSLSDQLYHDRGALHPQVRHEICNHLSHNQDEFHMFLLMEDGDEDVMEFEEYVEKMRGDGEWGGNVELVAASRVYGRGITIFSGGFEGGVWRIEREDGGERSASGNGSKNGNKNGKGSYEKSQRDEFGGADLCLSYHENDHYNSVHSIGASYSKQSTNKPLQNGKQSDNKREDDNPPTKGQHHNKHNKHSELDMESTNQSQQTSAGRKPLTRSSDCPCGSGLKYKKCCLAREKSKARRAKLLEKEGIEDINNDESKEENEYIGNFKVLSI